MESANPVRWAEPAGGAFGVTVSTPGDNTVLSPAGGKRLGLQYICLSADGGNSGDVTVIIKFGGSGGSKYKVSLKPGAIWARNIGARMRWLAGAVDEVLIANLSAAQNVHISVESEDV
jgi:hypothetical protein